MSENKDLGADAAAVEGAGSIDTDSAPHVDTPLVNKMSLSYLQRRFMLGTSNAMLLQDDLRHLERALAPAWQPISTAPKDGTYVLCYWDGGFQSLTDLRTLPLMRPQPTHWMPLPDPPVLGTGNQGAPPALGSVPSEAP